MTDCPDLSEIAFLLDGSGSVGAEDFKAMKNFVKLLIKSLRTKSTRVGTYFIQPYISKNTEKICEHITRLLSQ